MPGGHYKDRNRYFNQKTKTAHVRETTRSRPRPSPVDSGGRRANSTPNDGPHLELGRLRLKTWSKSDFSIAQTTSTYLHMSLYRAAPERAGRAFPRLVSLPLVPRKRRAETFDYPHVLISRETPTHELHQKHEAVDDRNTRPPPGQGQAGLRQKSEIKHHTIKGRKTLKSRMKDRNTGRQKGRETVRHDRQTE